MRMFKYIYLYSITTFAITSSMEQPLPKQPREQEEINPTKKSRIPEATTFADLPSEIQLHITHFINAPTAKEALQKIKAYLSANKELRAFYNDKSFIKSLLLDLQKRFHISMLELARMLASSISREIAQELTQEAEKSWQQYLSLNAYDLPYAEFIFRTSVDRENVPSLLYYVYSNPAYFDRAREPMLNGSLISQTLSLHTADKTISYWIESGLLNQEQHIQMIWRDVLHWSKLNTQTIAITQMLIDAGYANTILDPTIMKFTQPNVNRIKPSVLDYVINTINRAMNEIGRVGSQKIALLNQILRMLIKAGAKSNYELQQP